MKRSAVGEHDKRRLMGINATQTTLNDVLPLIESNLTIAEAAEKLGISVEATCALLVASLGSSPTGAQ